MMTTSKELLEMANTEWKNREERKGIHDRVSWVSGWISGYLTRNPQAEKVLDDINRFIDAYSRYEGGYSGGTRIVNVVNLRQHLDELREGKGGEQG